MDGEGWLEMNAGTGGKGAGRGGEEGEPYEIEWRTPQGGVTKWKGKKESRFKGARRP